MKTQKQHDQDGGPAYPATLHTEDNNGTHYEDHPGMTLRDWFAGQALGGIVHHWGEIHLYLKHNGAAHDATSIRKFMAGAAYAQADAMLAERNKPLNET